MIPDLRLGPFLLSIHGAAMGAAFIVGYALVRRTLGYHRQSPDLADSLLLAALVGGVVGARLWYVVTSWGDYRGNVSGALALWQGGLVWYGGFIGGILAVAAYVAWKRLPAGPIADATAIPLMAGYAVGRAFGDFLRGEEYGKPTTLPWGIPLPRGNPPTTVQSLQENYPWLHVQGPPTEVLAVHPTQLYEALAALAIVGVLFLVRASLRDRPGTLFGLGIGLYGLERFLVEFLRTNPPVALGLTAAQFTSLVFVLIGLVVFFRSGGWRPGTAGEGAAHAEDPARSGTRPFGGVAR